MQYLLGQSVLLKLYNDTPRVGVISAYTAHGMPKAKYIDDDGDLEESTLGSTEAHVLRESCTEKVSPSKHKIYYGNLCKNNVKLAENIVLKASETDIRTAIQEADGIFKSMKD